VDRVLGLELGADDYVAKPFDPRELVARIRSVLRRAREPRSKGTVAAGPFFLKSHKRQVSFEGRELKLTTMEYELLKLFMENCGKKFTRDEIIGHLRGFEADVFGRSVDILVSRLRGKIEPDPKEPRFLKTVWGTGYVFLGDANAA
jgi:DNA-binding response OmpR family regulator